MIVVKIELWPYGCKEARKLIGCCTIANDGTGDKKHGNYKACLTHTEKFAHKKGVWKQGEVKCFNRAKSPYHLLYLALKACLYPKKGK